MKKELIIKNKRKKKFREKFTSFIKENKIISFSLLIIILLLLGLIIFQIYLYVKFLIGNDLVVKTEIQEKNVNLSYLEERSIKIKLTAISNPFCSIVCENILSDLEKGEEERENFKLRTEISKQREFSIKSEKFSEGKKYFRYTAKCHNIKSFLCKTEEQEITREFLIPVYYSLDDAGRQIREEIRKNIEGRKIKLEDINDSITFLKQKLIEINNSLNEESNIQELNKIERDFEELNKEFDAVLQSWQNQKIFLDSSSIEIWDYDFLNFNDKMSSINDSIYGDIQSYNVLIEGILNKRNELLSFNNKKYNSSNFIILNESFRLFNTKLAEFKNSREIENKTDISVQITNIAINLSEDLTGEEINFSLDNIEKISFNFIEKNNSFVLKNPEPECCFKNCLSSYSSKFPIIFIHGHDFNQAISGERALDAFTKIQEKMEEEGIVNGGELSANQFIGINKVLDLCGKQASFKTSYYFDASSSGIVQTKTDSLDVYALRLKDIIEEIKKETGSEKVILVSHSMGGLVSRRYIQLFGEKNIDKFILINVPNHGISGRIDNLCGYFGAQLECRDLKNGSLFLDKLNSGEISELNITNIISVGCNMEGKDGDGIVLNESAILDEKNVNNIYFKGSCGSMTFLHNDLLDPEKYPEFYEKLVGFLKN